MKEEIEKPEQNKEPETLKMGFFKKIWYSITKIEKYPDMAAQGFGKAISYLAKVVAILAIILCSGMIYQISELIKSGVNYLENEFPEISYKDGVLAIDSENEIIISKENSQFGTTIIDTKDLEEETVNKYINTVSQEGAGLVILKDRIVIKKDSMTGTISYNYKETFEPLGLQEFNKQQIIDYATGSQIISIYITIFIILFVYAFISYLLIIATDTIFLSFFGYITTKLSRIRMRYVAIFNMSIYALTLSIILNMLYIAINIFIPFTITYFQVMYVAIAAIYLVAAILILKADMINKQMELMKIMEAEKIIKEQIKEEENKKKQEKEKKERKKKDKEKENEDMPDGSLPTGTDLFGR